MKRTRRLPKITIRFALLVLASLTSCRSAQPDNGLPPNFGVVEESRIYRGGQPDRENLEALRKLGIRTILKLNSGNAFTEEEQAARLGMRLICEPLETIRVGTRASCAAEERAYAALTDPANWPIYLHCEHGRDRTGFMVGMLRERAGGWTYQQVSRELEAYGHNALYRLLLPHITHALARGDVCSTTN